MNGENGVIAIRSVPLRTEDGVSDPLAREQQHASDLVRPAGGPVRVVARFVDTGRLSGLDQRIVDDGDLPPGWASWWLTLAAELAYNAVLWSRTPGLIVRAASGGAASGGGPLRRLLHGAAAGAPLRLLPLTVADVCETLPARSFANGFALVWGVPAAVMERPDFPVVCRGAVVPIVDGMGALFLASDEDLATLRAWTGSSSGETP